MPSFYWWLLPYQFFYSLQEPQKFSNYPESAWKVTTNTAIISWDRNMLQAQDTFSEMSCTDSRTRYSIFLPIHT